MIPTATSFANLKDMTNAIAPCFQLGRPGNVLNGGEWDSNWLSDVAIEGRQLKYPKFQTAA